MFSFMFNESLIQRARNGLVKGFLQSHATHLLFIDADIRFQAEEVLPMIEADKDVICGIYPKKEVDWDKVNAAAVAGKTDLQGHGGAFVFNMAGDSAETGEDGMIEVRHAGTGFMLIKRGVFEHLIPHVPSYRISSFIDPETGEYAKPLTHEFFTTSIDAGGALLSEDYNFCELFRKHGGKVHANPFIKLDHVGTYVYTGDIIKAGGNLK